MTKAEAAATLERLWGPTMIWHPDKEQPANVLKADLKFVHKPYDGIYGEVVCAPNGAGVNFKLLGKDGEPGPQFDWYEGDTGDGYVNITVRVDNKSHVAKGFLVKEKGDTYVNHVGVLFYEPGIAVKVRGQRQFDVRLGGVIDNIVGGEVRDAANAEIEEGLRTSAGPLSDLVNARSIQMEIPVREGNYKATLELNPQDATLHAFATRCYERFATPAKPVPVTAAPAPASPTPSRTRDATAPRRTTR
jgi:hypothetical protein